MSVSVARLFSHSRGSKDGRSPPAFTHSARLGSRPGKSARCAKADDLLGEPENVATPAGNASGWRFLTAVYSCEHKRTC